MRHRPRPSRLLAAAAAAILALGCSRDTSLLEPAPLSVDGTVFADGVGAGIDFQAFSGSKTDALTPDAAVVRVGSSGLRVTVPAPGGSSGTYAGGAFVSATARDLSGYTALTFWARASIAASLDVAGFGNDNTGNSQYTAQASALPLTTAWRKFVLPIPNAARLSSERGMFFFAEGPENGVGYDIWFDDIRFENIDVGTPTASIPSSTLSPEVGSTVNITGTLATYTIGGVSQVIAASARYFDFTSSNPAVASVSASGDITALGGGTTNITAQLGSVNATGTVVLTPSAPPATAAPVPTRAAADVISLFSNTYTNVPVATWSADFDQADVADITIAGNTTKRYTNLVFSAAEFTSPTVNATTMTHLHLDTYVLDAASFRIKLVDFGANGAFGGGDDTEHELALSPSTSPAIVANAWNSLDIPFSSFTGLTARGHLAQLILVTSSRTVYLDNVYFYRTDVVPPPAPTAPTTAAAAPTWAAGDAISLFSNTYTNRAVNTWSADWDMADVSDVQIASNDVKRYLNMVFAGIEFTGAPVNATAMTHFSMDVWTPDATAAPKIFKIKLVDFGANGVFDGGDDKEHEITLTAATTPALATGGWVRLDIPFTAFTGLTTRGSLAQLIFSGDLRTLYVDNVLFHR